MSIDEQTLDYLEAHIPDVVKSAVTQAYWQTLASGSSVLERDGSNLVEVFPDGQRKIIKPLSPQIPVEYGRRLKII